MEVIRVEGGYPVTGTVTVEGAKNSALKLMAATILAPGVTTLENVPNISDVHIMGKVLKELGATVVVVDEHTLRIDTSTVDSWETPYSLVAQMRASTAVLGPLLARFGKAIVAMPGGCNIGARKIDMHILGLEALGVRFDVDHGDIHATAPNGLVGTTVTLDFASVGATENLIMASVHAKGTTVIDNAAREPEIVDLANMLHEMGADIQGAGSPVIEIHGVGE
ncbi:MAG: UDP-N-acetylglucosamine 1-carboxyvinyltransferase, partial [Coriobacteriales bacterium]|nr:UDP-N-acetylglucosamine 1-carboxyvinyltransferase [Coriobacteriales bacterium]